MPGGTLAKAVPAVRLLCLPLRACPYFHVPCSPCIRCSPRIRMLPASCPVSRLTARMERAAADWPAYSVALCLGAHLDAYHVSRELCLVLRLGAFRCESERPSASSRGPRPRHAAPRGCGTGCTDAKTWHRDVRAQPCRCERNESVYRVDYGG